MTVKKHGSRKEMLKKSKSLPSQAIKESISHEGHKENTEVKIVIETNGKEIKDSDDEMVETGSVQTESIDEQVTSSVEIECLQKLQSISKKRKNRRKKRSGNKASEYDDENMQKAGVIEAIKTNEKSKNDSKARGVDNTEANEVFEKLEGNDKDDTEIDFEDSEDSEVDSEEEIELRKICARDFGVDEKYEDYDPKDLKYWYGHELSLIKEKRTEA